MVPLSTSTALLAEPRCVEIEERELCTFFCADKGSTTTSSGAAMMDLICRWSEGATAGRQLFLSCHLPALVGHRPLTGPGGYTILGHPLDTQRCEVAGRSVRCTCAAESNSTTFCSDQMIFIAMCVFLLLSGKNRNIIEPINCQRLEPFDSYHFFHPPA